MPCDSDQMWSAIMRGGGRLAAGMPATSASQAARSAAQSCGGLLSMTGAVFTFPGGAWSGV